MKNTARERPAWLIRLIDEINKRDMSYRQISTSSGLGPNFVSQLMDEERWKEPLFSTVTKICGTLGISLTYIVTGVHMTQREEEILRLLAKLDDQRQEHLLGLIRPLLREDAR